MTKQPLDLLSEKKIEKLNEQITQGTIHHTDGSVVNDKLHEGLITRNRSFIYRIDSDIPIMLQDQSIPAKELKLK